MGKPDQLSRRRLLGAMAGAVGVGAVGGVGTRAFLTDEEVIPGEIVGDPYAGGRLQLDLNCGESAACSDDGSVEFAFTDINPPASGSTSVCFAAEGRPSWLWLRSSPPPTTTLADVLSVTLTYDDGTPVTVDGSTVEGWSLAKLLAAFEDGEQLLDGKKLPPGQQRCLQVSWSLPDDSDVAGERVTFGLTVAAVQYRENASPSNPWSDSS